MTPERAKEILYDEWQSFLENNLDYAGISDAYKLAFKALEQMSNIEDIKSEIQALPKTYPFVNHIDTYVKDADVIKIIERHCGGDKE